MKDSTISVIIPVYNAETYLKECLGSVVQQSLQDIEIICIDDGSTDGSVSIIEAYRKAFPYIKLLRQENQGAGAARNRGIEYASGKYIAFMDADDCYPHQDTLRKLYTSAESSQKNICGGNLLMKAEGSYKKAENIQFSGEEDLDYEKLQESYWFHKYIYSREFLVTNKIFFPQYKRYEDPVFFVKAMTTAKRFHAVAETVYTYRIMHKKVKYTREVVLDVLRGYKDVMRLAADNHLWDLYRSQTEQLTYGEMRNVVSYYVLRNDRAIIAALKEINQLRTDCKAKDSGPLTTKEEIQKYYFEAQKEGTGLRRFRNIVIYGAGHYGKKALELLEENMNQRVLGFAVTDITADTPKKMGDYPIKTIENYEKELAEGSTGILIAVSCKYKSQIYKYVEALGYGKDFCIDYDRIELYYMMQKEYRQQFK